MTCYLCDPENPPPPEVGQDATDAWNEACVECDHEFWENPVFIILDPADLPPGDS